MIHFYIDDFGYLWAGPFVTAKGARYCRFEGWEKGKQVWPFRCEDPQDDWYETTSQHAKKIVARHRTGK